MDEPDLMPMLLEIAERIDLEDTIQWIKDHIYPHDEQYHRPSPSASSSG